MNLYELSIEGQEMERLLIESDGVLTPDLEIRFDGILGEGKDRVDAALFVRQSMIANEGALADEMDRLSKRAQAIAKDRANLEARILHAVDSAYGGKFKSPCFTAWGQTSQGGVGVEMAPDADMLSIPEQLVKTTRELRKTEIKAWVASNGPDSLPEVVITPYAGKRGLRVR